MEKHYTKKHNQTADKWMIRADSCFEKAKYCYRHRGILYEDMCFDCQQAVEKALKALLVSGGRRFPKTHTINVLISILRKSGYEVTHDIRRSSALTQYAVETRYPGDYEPVDEDEYLDAIFITEEVMKWVRQNLKKL